MLEAVAGAGRARAGLSGGRRPPGTAGTSSATSICSWRPGRERPGPGRPPRGCPPPLTEARRDVLYAVRRRGEATVDQVAESLGMTVSGARQHLAALADAGLVAARELPSAGPRAVPARCTGSRRRADALFPKAYGELTNELLGYLDADLERVLFDRRRDRPHRARRRAGLGGRRSPSRWPSWPASSTRTATWRHARAQRRRDASTSSNATAPSPSVAVGPPRGVPVRARVHPCCAPGRDGRPDLPHGGRGDRVRLPRRAGLTRPGRPDGQIVCFQRLK